MSNARSDDSSSKRNSRSSKRGFVFAVMRPGELKDAILSAKGLHNELVGLFNAWK